MKTYSFSSVALILGVLALPAAAHASLLGDTVDVRSAYPDSNTPFQDYGSYPVPGGGSANILASFTLLPTQITITDNTAYTFLPSTFNGLEFTDTTRDPGISGVTVDSISTLSGATVTSTSDEVLVNLQGLSVTPGQTLVLDLQFAQPSSVTPEPSSMALLGTGLVGVAGLMRRRFAQA